MRYDPQRVEIRADHCHLREVHKPCTPIFWRITMSDPFHSSRSDAFRSATGTANIPGWAVILTAIIAGGLGIGLFLLSAGILLVLAPIAVAGVLYARWRIRRALRRAAEAGSIEAEYRVIDLHREP